MRRFVRKNARPQAKQENAALREHRQQNRRVYGRCVVAGGENPIKERIKKNELYKLYNIGNNNSVKLLDFIKEIEINLETEAKKNMLPIQPGDVERTWANVDDLINDYDYKPNTSIKYGVKAFVDWYKKYYK